MAVVFGAWLSIVSAAHCNQEVQISAPLPSVIVGDRVFWKGTGPHVGVLRLCSASLLDPANIDERDFPLMWSLDKPIAWHIYRDELWAMTGCEVLPPKYENFYLARAGLRPQESSTYVWGEHVIARCEPLQRLRNSLRTEVKPAIYFAYVPKGGDRGRLYALDSTREIAVWEYSSEQTPRDRLIDPTDQPVTRLGQWTLVDKLKATFFEQFQVYGLPDGPRIITRSGALYTLGRQRDEDAIRTFEKTDTGRIVAVIDDSRTGNVHAVTKTACFSLREPGSTKPFDFSDVTVGQEDIARALVRAVRFINDESGR